MLNTEQTLTYQSVERKFGLTAKVFKSAYLKAKKPVILTDFMDNWEAKEKWSFDFFKENYGKHIVPLYSTEEYSKPGKNYMKPSVHMPFKEYIEMLEAGPTDLRMFLFNILNEAKELTKDVGKPTIMGGFVKDFPFLFFGGKGGDVRMHFDLDYSNVFLNQFQGRKRIILFPPEQSKLLYKHPYTVKSHINPLKPDLQRFPAFKHAKGYECVLEPGETLFMPMCYWHYVYYEEASFSLSLRANPSLYTRFLGISSIATHYVVDHGMNKLFGKRWLNMKDDIANRRADLALY